MYPAATATAAMTTKRTHPAIMPAVAAGLNPPSDFVVTACVVSPSRNIAIQFHVLNLEFEDLE